MNILFCHTGLSSFVKADIEILSDENKLTFLPYKISKSKIGKLYNVLSSILLSVYYVPKSDAVYSFFAGYHCYFPILIAKLLSKKTVVTIGGFDSVSVPSIQYGVFHKNNLLQFCVKSIYKIADVILPVHSGLILSDSQYLKSVDTKAKSGILNFISKTKGLIIEIPTGYDPELFMRNRNINRKAGVLSVASIESDQDFIRKGFDFIFEIAENNKDIEFVLAGFNDIMGIKMQKSKPENVIIKGFQTGNELVDLYSEYKIFLQLSLCEGLPNTLCEAMLCECIPIGTDVNGIPDVIGDVGEVIVKKDILKIEKLIRLYLSDSELTGIKSRERIIENYHISKRKKKLSEVFYLLQRQSIKF